MLEKTSDRRQWPRWVRLALIGIHSGRAARTYAAASLLIALTSIAVSLSYRPIFFTGTVLILAAAWYWRAAAWVDANGQWRR